MQSPEMTISQDATFFVCQIVPIILSNLLCGLFLFHPTGKFPNLEFFSNRTFRPPEKSCFPTCVVKTVFFFPKSTGVKAVDSGRQTVLHSLSWESQQSSVLPLSSQAQEIYTLALSLALPLGSQSAQSTSLISRSQYSYIPLARILLQHQLQYE